MPGRNKSLITRNGIPDPQAYNPQTGQWESFIGVSWGKTAGGLYVPIRVDDQGRQEVTLSGTMTTQELSVSTMGAGDVTEQIQTWIVDPNQASKLIGVFVNIRSDTAATSGNVILRAYLGTASIYNQVFEVQSTSMSGGRIGVRIQPYGIQDFCKVSLPLHIERDISAYLEHCARFTFGAGTPLILELISTLDAGISTTLHRQLRVLYTS